MELASSVGQVVLQGNIPPEPSDIKELRGGLLVGKKSWAELGSSEYWVKKPEGSSVNRGLWAVYLFGLDSKVNSL